MSIGVNTAPTRDQAEGVLSLHEIVPPGRIMHHREIARAIEARLTIDPPTMFVDCSDDDVLLSFALGGAFSLGGTVGPTWQFSLREALRFDACDPGDKRRLAGALRRLAGDFGGELAGKPEEEHARITS